MGSSIRLWFAGTLQILKDTIPQVLPKLLPDHKPDGGEEIQPVRMSNQ